MFQYLQQVCRAFVSFAPYWRLPLRMPLVIQPPFRLRKLFSPKIFVHHFHFPLLMLLMHTFASFRYLLYILPRLAWLVSLTPSSLLFLTLLDLHHVGGFVHIDPPSAQGCLSYLRVREHYVT